MTTCPRCSTANVDEARFCVGCGKPLELPSTHPGESDPLIGQLVADRYRLLEVLGEGAMSRVYRAEQQMGSATRSVAVKVLKADVVGDRTFVARFRRECETVITLSHPNTIQFYDFGELPDGTLYIVMEYVQGASLYQVLTHEGPLAPERVQRIVGQVCGALEDAHSRGVIHRDLKPENILLSSPGSPNEFVKVLDFGIAKRAVGSQQQDATLTQRGTVLGTPPYMSPEQFAGKKLDARSDIYSLAVLTYQMLTGAMPFEASTPWQWASMHVSEPPTPIDAHPAARAVPEPMKAAVMRALAKEPRKRPQSATEFHRALGEAGSAPPPAPSRSTPPKSAQPTPPPPASQSVSLPMHRGCLWAAGAVIAVGIVAAGAGAVYFISQRDGDGPAADAGGPIPVRPEPAGGDAGSEEPRDAGPSYAWFGSVHHVRDASNAQLALGPRDGKYAMIERGGFVTLELGPDRHVHTDGDRDGTDLWVFVADETGRYSVEVGHGHHGLRTVVRSTDEPVELDLDRVGIDEVRYVRIRSRDRDEVLLDTVASLPHPDEH